MNTIAFHLSVHLIFTSQIFLNGFPFLVYDLNSQFIFSGCIAMTWNTALGCLGGHNNTSPASCYMTLLNISSSEFFKPGWFYYGLILQTIYSIKFVSL